jgi:AcrR family transcriptional regulator
MSDAPLLGQLLATADEEFDPYAERILAAAQRQFAEFGLRRTSLDDIARAADVGRATLFRRFPNRDALLWALAAREARAGIAAVDERVAAIEDPEEFLVTGAIEMIHVLARNGLLQRLLVTDAEQMLPLLTTQSDMIMAMGREYIAAQMRRLRERGAAIEGDIDVLAELLARLTLSLAMNPRGVVPLDDDERLEEILRSTVVPLILRSEGGSRGRR